MLKRLKYMSRLSQPLSQDAIERIAALAATNNRSKGVTGMMMAWGGVFFQILEGPAGAVDELYAKIAKDPRHTDVLCLRVEENREERLFGDWSMRLVDASDDSVRRSQGLREKLTALMDLQKQVLDASTQIERDVWEEARTKRSA